MAGRWGEEQQQVVFLWHTHWTWIFVFPRTQIIRHKFSISPSSQWKQKINIKTKATTITNLLTCKCSWKRMGSGCVILTGYCGSLPTLSHLFALFFFAAEVVGSFFYVLVVVVGLVAASVLLVGKIKHALLFLLLISYNGKWEFEYCCYICQCQRRWLFVVFVFFAGLILLFF